MAGDHELQVGQRFEPLGVVGLRFGPGLDVVAEALAVWCHDSAGAIPTTPTQHMAELALRQQLVGPRQQRAMVRPRQQDRDFSDETLQGGFVGRAAVHGGSSGRECVFMRTDIGLISHPATCPSAGRAHVRALPVPGRRSVPPDLPPAPGAGRPGAPASRDRPGDRPPVPARRGRLRVGVEKTVDLTPAFPRHALIPRHAATRRMHTCLMSAGGAVRSLDFDGRGRPGMEMDGHGTVPEDKPVVCNRRATSYRPLNPCYWGSAHAECGKRDKPRRGFVAEATRFRASIAGNSRTSPVGRVATRLSH